MMKQLTMIGAVLLVAAGSAVAQAGKIVDRVLPRKGAAVEGVVQKDTYKEVVIQITGGSTTPFASADVLKIEYGDAPPSFKGAMGDIEASSFEEALQKINNAETYVADLVREKKPVPRAWFAGYVSFYRGLCLREIGRGDPKRLDDALVHLTKLVEGTKDSRFLAEAFGLALECCAEKGDSTATDAWIKRIEAAPTEIRPALQKRAAMQRAESLLGEGKVDEARLAFDQLSHDSDREIGASATEGVIRCLTKANKPDQLANYCKGVLAASANEPALLLVASNAMADSLLAQKKTKEAVKQYVDSVVRYHPGRGSRLAREHERALLMLGKSYEALMGETKDEAAKKSYQIMAGRTYRELVIEYPLGKYKDEAAGRAAELDK
jgi:hypothetical protein